MSSDKKLAQESIAKAGKKKGEWAKFQVLYDLHPLVRYFMTKLEAGVDKDVASAARLSSILPGDTAWFILNGQVSNNLGQPVISDFFVLAVNNEGGLYRKPLPLKEFIQEFNLLDSLYNEDIPGKEILALESLLSPAIEFGQMMHMGQLQKRL